MVGENRMTKGAALPQYAKTIQVLNRRSAMAPEHFMKLMHALSNASLPRQITFACIIKRTAQAGRLTRIHLSRIHHAAQAAARMLIRSVDNRHLTLHRALARRNVPLVIECMTIVGVPPRIAKARCGNGPNATCPEQIQPTLKRRRKIYNGRATVTALQCARCV